MTAVQSCELWLLLLQLLLVVVLLLMQGLWGVGCSWLPLWLLLLLLMMMMLWWPGCVQGMPEPLVQLHRPASVLYQPHLAAWLAVRHT